MRDSPAGHDPHRPRGCGGKGRGDERSEGVEIVSLDEVEAAETSLETAVDDDVELEDEGGDDDDTFLEEEEEDSDDVTGLIDGDLAPDEEP